MIPENKITPECRMQFIVHNTNKQQLIIKDVYDVFDKKLLLWQQVNKCIDKIPELFKQFKKRLDEWKFNFYTETSFYPTRDTPEESLNAYRRFMYIFGICIANKTTSDELPNNMKDLLEEALGILLEMEICLPTDEEITNGYK